MKNNLFTGIIIGLLVCFITMLLADAALYFMEKSTGRDMMGPGEIWAVSIIFNLFLMRKFMLDPLMSKTGRGILFAMFLWGAAYVYLFHITKTPSLFFS